MKINKNGDKMEIKVGELFRFSWFAGSRTLSGRQGLYMGEAFIHREDGVTVENHRVLMIGDEKETIIDRGLLKYMERRLEDPSLIEQRMKLFS